MRNRSALVCAVALLSAACTQKAIVRETGPVMAQPPPRNEAVAGPGIGAVLEQARAHLGKRSVQVNGQSFRYDCSGFVTGVFSVLDVDLMSLGNEFPSDNGVRLIHHFNERHGRNHMSRAPSPGDVVYFDNTWDMNGNGLLDDPLTHVGVVDSIDPDGTFHIIHLSNRGIVRDPMNLLRPHDRADENGKPLNAWLRAKGRRDPPDAKRLMGELFAGFGTVGLPRTLSSAQQND